MTTQPYPIKLSVPEARLFWEIEVLYEDEHLLAVAKPAGLHSSPHREDPRMPYLLGLLHAGIAQGKPFATSRNLTYLASAHRLDPEISGVLLLAKSKSVLIAMANEFSQGKPYLGYVALVAGDLGQAKLTVNAGVVEHPQRPERNTHRRHAENRISRRLYRVGQLHSAKLIVLRRRQHAGTRVRRKRVMRRLRQDHLLAIEMRLLQINQPIERRELFFRNFLRRVEHRAERLSVVIGKARTCTKRLHVKPAMKQKI